jgi:hypothetical protein
MITVLNIGYNGRMGNQMFQFAAVLGIARKLKYEVAFPQENGTEIREQTLHDNTINRSWFELPTCFNINPLLLKEKSRIEKQVKRTITEKTFEFSSHFFSWWRMRDNVNLIGYFQTYKYFDHIKEELYSNFTFKDEYINEAKKLLPNN